MEYVKTAMSSLLSLLCNFFFSSCADFLRCTVVCTSLGTLP